MSSQLTIIELENPFRRSGAELFSFVCQQPWSMLLDSADSPHADSQWDILAVNPVAWLTANGKQCELWQDGQSTHMTDDPLSALEHLIQKHFPQPAQTPGDLPFSGGALGMAGYDLGWAFERLPSLAPDETPIPDLAFGIYTQVLLVEQASKRCVLVSQPSVKAFTFQPSLASFWQEKLNKSALTEPGSFTLQTAWHSNLGRQAYGECFRQVQSYLRSGDCYQVNLARRFSANCHGFPWDAYLALREANKAPFSAFINLPQGQILSVSPERFLRVDSQRQVETRPIKGTRPRFDAPDADQAQINDLANAPKDRAENLMIVDLLRNDISRTCKPGSVRVPELFAVESFPAVHHLVSTITGTLQRDSSSLDLLRGAFPGGSITGAPKIRAMEIIHQLEPHRRHSYCGSIVALSADGKMDSSITIRTLICAEQQLHCWAGGGLVADSDEQSEFEETEHKLGKILPVLNSFYPKEAKVHDGS